MELEISKIDEAGNQNKEEVTIEVRESCNLHYYILCDTSYTDTTHISNKLRNTYWLPKKVVAKGDFVVVRTGSGKAELFENRGGSVTHVLYWGLGRPVWNNSGDCALLFKVSNWKATRA